MRENYIDWDSYFMGIALLSSMRSKDPNTQVGACIVNEDKRIVGVGYNGLPKGCEDTDFPWEREGDFLETKYPYVCHAELNAILNSIKSLKDCIIYVALFPCNECSKAIIQSGIKEIVYLSDKYDGTDTNRASKKMLDSAGVKYRQFTPNMDKLEIDFKNIQKGGIMLEALKESVVFNKIQNEDIKKILEETKHEIKTYSPNETIAFRGDEVKGLYVILKGTLSTEMLTEEGNVIKIEELVKSDVIASAFIFGSKNCFPVDLKAKEKAEVLFIERKEFLKLLFSQEQILENFLNEISNKTQLLTTKIWNNFNNKTIKKKFCNYVNRKQEKGEFSIENLGALAEFFGVERPSLSRVLSDLVKDEKLERIGRNRYKILDKEFFEI